ncbi:hypothetical protein [Fischerella sp. JS2]|uniref:hypothetical protein n=1 Tax=Fischerella sp. JS2 TaxID=2597771 RepID=UPI0028F0DAA5|nr:hypothetical protein [Fischerella sp. JS2]
MTTNQYTPLFRLVSKFLKYFLLTLFGFAIAYVLSISLGILDVVPILIFLLQRLFVPLGTILLCLIVIAVLWESLR